MPPPPGVFLRSGQRQAVRYVGGEGEPPIGPNGLRQLVSSVFVIRESHGAIMHGDRLTAQHSANFRECFGTCANDLGVLSYD